MIIEVYIEVSSVEEIEQVERALKSIQRAFYVAGNSQFRTLEQAETELENK